MFQILFSPADDGGSKSEPARSSGDKKSEAQKGPWSKVTEGGRKTDTSKS